jgi:centrosomal protein CEP104
MGGSASKTASRTPASGHPNRQAAAAAGGQQQRPKQQQHAPRQQQQHSQPPSQEQQVLAGLEAEDPAPFMAELGAREQQYGPNHAAVAESCSNLAILYNQKGDYNAALPLYERALAIYEANYGPNHQEVAHTLTDLAVLHLEQVKAKCCCMKGAAHT